MLKHYIALAVLTTILAYNFNKLIKKNKLSAMTCSFIAKGRESSIVTTAGLSFIILCLFNLTFYITFFIKEFNYLGDKGIYLNLVDLLVGNKINLLIESLSMDIRENIFKISSLIDVRKSLFTSIYTIYFIFVGIYFYYKNSRIVYIANDGIYKFGTLYRWDSNKIHQWDKVFGRQILHANVIDENGRPEIISLKIDKKDKKTLETSINSQNFTDN